MKLRADEVPPWLRLFVTDTLGNPFVEQEWIPSILEPLADSRKHANEILDPAPGEVHIGVSLRSSEDRQDQ